MQHAAVLQPAYSNTSSASNNVVDLSSFPSSGLDLSDAALASGGEGGGSGFQPLQLTHPSQDEDEEESENPVAFANGVLCQK